MPSKDMTWMRVLAEGAVIVGSILLAFALDAWWDDRNRWNELEDQLGVVAREMRSTEEALQRALAAHDAIAGEHQGLTVSVPRSAARKPSAVPGSKSQYMKLIPPSSLNR